MRTTAARDGAGCRLTGEKIWIHNAPVADFAVVLARTDPAAGKRGMSIFLVDADAPGYERGRKEHKMGQRASQVGALAFNDVALRARRRCSGEEGRGFHMMMSVLDKGRVGIAALAVGILQEALEAVDRLCQEPAPVRAGDRRRSRPCSGSSPTSPRRPTPRAF